MRVLVLHGPNLTLEVDPERSLPTLESELLAHAKTQNPVCEIRVFQAETERALIERLLAEREWLDAVIVNPSSLAPVAFTLADALMRVGKRAVEVQLDALPKSWPVSALKEAVESSFVGVDAYVKALDALGEGPPCRESEDFPRTKSLGRVVGSTSPGTASSTKITRPERPVKTLGRAVSVAAPSPEPEAEARPAKTLGRGAPTSTAAAPASSAGSSITRVSVRERAGDRLSGKISPEQLALWARAQWQALISGAPVEPGAKDILEDALLALSASAKATEHVILNAIAKLDR